jgi:hypothetical protein
MKMKHSFLGHILTEGIIVMTALNIILGLTFASIRYVNTSRIQHIHKQRSAILLASTFEKILSSRDTFVNMNTRTGWNHFINPVQKAQETHPNQLLSFQIKRTGSPEESIIPGQWFLERNQDPEKITSEIIPYAEYKIYIYPKFSDETKERLIFLVSVRWAGEENKILLEKEFLEASENIDAEYYITDTGSIRQEFTLSNNRIYENLY